MINSTSLSEICATCISSCAYLAPDPDVAGQGVVIAFLAASVLTWICASVRILDWYLHDTSSRNKIDVLLRYQKPKSKSSSILNSRNLLPPIAGSRYTPSRTTTPHIAYPSVMTLLLSLHDTQLISGLAISATTLIRHRSDNISVYHFSVAADLSWVASGTQLVCFLFIRWDISLNSNSRQPKRSKRCFNSNAHAAAQYFRALCMLIQFALLLWQSYIQGDQRWNSSYACPTACLDRAGRAPVFGGTPVRRMLLNIIFATWGYTTALLPMCIPLLGFWRAFVVRCNLVSVTPLSYGTAARRIVALTKVLRICNVPLVFLWYFLTSIVIDTVMQLGWFATGAYMLAVDRKWGNAYFSGEASLGKGCDPIPNTEQDWGFGQIFPVMLLILPVMGLLQAYGDEAEKALETDDTSSSTEMAQAVDDVPVVE